MKHFKLIAATMMAAMIFMSCNRTQVDKPDQTLEPVSFEKVKLQDEFWLPRLITQKETLVPFSMENTEPAVENLRRVGEYLRTGKQQKMLPLMHYVASDLFKVMEGAAYLLTLEKDPELEKKMDEIIDIIGEAQCADGYLYETHSVPPSMFPRTYSTGTDRYSFVDHSHELYDMGHMYEAAIAYYKATGKRKWLDIAEKNARHINKVFFEGDPAYNGGKPVNQAPGHEEIELALVKLYKATGEKLYLDMAKRFIDIRGVSYRPEGEGVQEVNYAQQHLPVREQRTAEGHCVRALYLYSGMADIAAQCGDETLYPALDAIWHNIADTKIHINGGVGSVPGLEKFGPEYLLPNMNTYDETCAAVANVFFNYRMFLATGDGKYVDMAEISLYNNVLGGMNLEGNRFFYVNVLEADAKHGFNQGDGGRAPWFGTACCPSNLARLIPQISGMIYSHTDDDIFCALYAGSSTDITLADGKVRLVQSTGYPFDGKVSIEVTPEYEGKEFTLWLRIPTWNTDRFIPGDLYRYADDIRSSACVKVNGKKVRTESQEGYLPVRRSWKAGDKVELELDMPVRYNVADERVEADVNRICLTKGPILYCAEEPDNQDNPSLISMDGNNTEFKESKLEDGVMKGIPVISVNASAAKLNGTIRNTVVKLIPYYSWNNRGDWKKMNVWFARDKETAVSNIPTIPGKIIDVHATRISDDIYGPVDGQIPSSSADESIPRWTSYNDLGLSQQYFIYLEEEQEIKIVKVYWHDNNDDVKIPASWTIDYHTNGEWKEFKPCSTDIFGIAKDEFNMVRPDHAVKADAIRLNIVAQKDACVGILETTIE
jgi:DUF1680 family protein